MVELRRLLPVAVAGGLVLVLFRVLDLGAALAGLDLSMSAGRARWITLVTARLPAPLLADAILIGVAVTARHVPALRALAWAHLAGGAFLVLAIPIYITDSARLVGTIPSAEAPAFRLLVTRVLVILAGLGAGGFAAARLLFTSARDGPGLPVPGAPSRAPAQ